MLSQARLKELVRYDPETGHFYWLTRGPGHWSDLAKPAGCLTDKGYIQIMIGGHTDKGHRFAWLYMTGSWPTFEIDHEDTVKSNNAWTNLREATHTQNAQNRAARGVRLVGYSRNYTAQIRVERRLLHLGTFKTEQEATDAYRAAAQHYFGDFAFKETRLLD